MTTYTVIAQPRGPYIYKEAPEFMDEDIEGYIAMPMEILTFTELKEAAKCHAGYMYSDKEMENLHLLRNGEELSIAECSTLGDDVFEIYVQAKADKYKRDVDRREAAAETARLKAVKLAAQKREELEEACRKLGERLYGSTAR